MQREGGQKSGPGELMVDISVVIPAYNVAAYVGATLNSLLRQQDADFEIILADDGSTDPTFKIVEAYAAKFAAVGRRFVPLSGRRGSSGAARNAAMEQAQGRLVCFVDADDVLHPGALARLERALGDHPDADLAFPLCRHVDMVGNPTGVTSSVSQDRFDARDLLLDNPIHTTTAVTVRRERAEAVGPFDTGLPACIELDYWIRVAGARPAAILAVRDVLVDYRTRPGQITGDWRRMRRGLERVAARAVEAGFVHPSVIEAPSRPPNVLVWATAAYKNGDYRAARRLTRELWRKSPGFALRDPHARTRTLASLATMLPAPLHDWIRIRYNG